MQMPKTDATMKYTSLTKTLFLILQEEGIGRNGICKGFTATMLREATYSSLRLGLYEPFKRGLGFNDPK